MARVSWKGAGRVVIASLGMMIASTPLWAGDPYLDMLAAEASKVGEVATKDEAGPGEDKVGDGFSPLLSQEGFAAEMKRNHAGGNVLFVRLSPQERDNIYLDYYKKGASYQQVVDVMAKWLKDR